MVKSMRVRWTGHVAYMGKKRNACRIFVGKPLGKRQLLLRRRKDNIKMDLKEIKRGGIDWIHLNRNRNQWKAL
jgi:hypothetical protein